MGLRGQVVDEDRGGFLHRRDAVLADVCVGGEDPLGEPLHHGAREGEVLRGDVSEGGWVMGVDLVMVGWRERRGKGKSTSMLMPSRPREGVPSPAALSSLASETADAFDLRGGMMAGVDGEEIIQLWRDREQA